MVGEGGADSIPVNLAKSGVDPARTPPVSETLGGGYHEHEVSQNTFKVVDIPVSDRDTYVVKTVARIGCDAVLAWRLDPTGGDHILMTHYDPMHINEHLRVLRSNFPSGEGEIRTVLVMAGAAEKNKPIIDYLEQATGTLPDVVIPGDDAMSLEVIGRFMTDYPIAYQLIFTKGYNGRPGVRRIIVPREKLRGSKEDPGNAYEKIFDGTNRDIIKKTN